MEYSIKPKILGERRIIHYPQKRIIGLYVYNMTEPVLKLPTDELFEVIHERDALKRACSKKDSEIADRDAKLADQNAKLADQDAKLAEYKRRYGDL